MPLLQKYSWIRTVYLYLFSVVGLVLIVIGLVRLIDLGLKVYLFTEADRPESIQPAAPYPPAVFLNSKMEISRTPPIPSWDDVELSKGVERVTPEEKQALEQWLAEYRRWQTTQAEVNFLRARREQEASNALAFLIVGIPLYFYHWAVIKRDRRKEEST